MKYRSLFLTGTLSLLFFVGSFIYPAYAQVSIQPGCYYNNQNTGAPDFSTGPVAPVGSGAGQGCPAGASSYNANGTVATQGVNGNLSYTPLEPLTTSGTTPNSFCGILNLIFKILIYLGGMVAVLFLVLGGITYMVSEVVTKRSKARERIKAAVWGLLILLCSYIILYTVNPALTTSCNVLGSANALGVLNSPTTPQPQEIPQIVITPDTNLPGIGNPTTIEDVVKKEVVKAPGGDALTLTVPTVSDTPAQTSQQIAAYKQNCTSQNGTPTPVNGQQIGALSSQTVWVCTVN
jgi:hypothetical protein